MLGVVILDGHRQLDSSFAHRSRFRNAHRAFKFLCYLNLWPTTATSSINLLFVYKSHIQTTSHYPCIELPISPNFPAVLPKGD